MVNFFISYRRADSAGYAGRLASSLEARLGQDRVFRDVEDINPGDDFVKSLEHNLKNAAVFLVIIGKDWLDAGDDAGRRRLDNPNDYVRIEIETALRHEGLLIPVLVGGAAMPDAADLPESIAAIANRQAIEITDSRWEEDIQRLINRLKGASIPVPNASKFRKWRHLAIAAAVLASAGILLLAAKMYFLTPDLSGNWYFERGDYLLIRQDGDHLTVERIDPAMQTTYEKGAGFIKGRHVEFDLEPIYSQQYRYRGNFELSWQGDGLSGELVEVLSNQAMPLVLSREKPKKPE